MEIFITILVILYILNLILLKNLPLFVADYYMAKYGFWVIMIPFVVFIIIIKEEIWEK